MVPPEPALLARGAGRSEHDPDLEVAASFAMRPVTGSFVDPAVESAFGAHLFRLAFPVHTLLFCFSLAVSVWIVGAGVKGETEVWKIITFGAVLGMACRVLLHVNYRSTQETVIAQRLGSRAWVALLVVCNLALTAGNVLYPAVACLAAERDILMPLVGLATALINGSHGMTFAPKLGVIGALILVDLSIIAICGLLETFIPSQAGLSVPLCDMGTLFVGFVLAHMTELYLRHSYAEKYRLTEDKWRLEQRNEQLQAEKERLQYDVQRRGHPFDDDNRSAVRRGLQAGQDPYHRHDSASWADPSEAGGPAPSDSPPPSFPPGAPSSTEGKSSTAGESTPGVLGYDVQQAAHSLVCLQSATAGQASQCVGQPSAGAGFFPVHGGAGARAESAYAGVASAAGVDYRHRGASYAAAGAAGAEGAPPSLRSSAGAGEEAHTSHKRFRQATMAPPTMVGPPFTMAPPTIAMDAGSASPMSGGLLGFLLDPLRQPRAAQPPPPPPQQQPQQQQKPQPPPQQQQQPSRSCNNGQGSSSWEAAAGASQGRPNGSLNHWQPPPPQQHQQPPPSLPGSVTPSQQALQVACLCLQREHADAEACQVVRALAVSLGASRVESGTIKALHAVVLQIVRPGMSDTEAYNSTAASGSNFFKWRRLVRDAQLDHLCQSTRLPPA